MKGISIWLPAFAAGVSLGACLTTGKPWTVINTVIASIDAAVLAFVAISAIKVEALYNPFSQHEHDPRPVAVKHETLKPTDSTMPFTRGEPGGDVTHVLYRCSCGINEPRTLRGHWTLGELLGTVQDEQRKIMDEIDRITS